MSKTALVLSGGGMFGAYQAGVCEVLLPEIRPDVFVGVSVGALNAWALAGKCTGSELSELWRQSIFDTSLRTVIEERIRDLYDRFQRDAPIGIVAAELRRLRPVLFRNEEITWRHLAASCAVLGFLPQQKLDGRIYSDGGMLDSYPLWAAADMGATRIVGINTLPRMTGAIRAVVSLIRTVSPWTPPKPGIVQTITIKPRISLGSARDALYWKRENVQRWIEQGRHDAEEKLEQIKASLA